MNQVEIKRRQIQLCSLALGLVIIWIFGKQLGDNGVAYLAAALEVFAFMWVIIGACVPDTLGKLLRGRSARGQYKNADKLCKSTLIFQGIVGVAGSILFLVLAQYLAETVLRVPYSRFLIMLLAPAVFLRSVSAVFLGSFQGEGSELPTAVASVLRPLLLLGFGFLFSRMLAAYGEKVSMLLGQAAFTSMYGALGVVIAVLLTELLVLFFLLLIYKGSGRGKKKRENEGMRTTDSFGGQVYVLYGNMWFSILIGLLLLLPLVLGVVFYQKSVADIYLSANSYGLYVGKYLVFCGIMIALLAACVLPVAVKAASMFRREDLRSARIIFQSGMKSILVYGMFGTVLFAVMAEQLAATFSESMVGTFAQMLTAGSGIVVLGTLAYFCYMVLKLSGKKYWVAGCLAGSCMVYVTVLAVWLGKDSGNIMVLVYAGLVYTGVLAVSLCALTCIMLRTGLDWLRIFAIPIGSVCGAGLLCYLLGNALTPHLGGAVTLLVVFLLTGLLYLLLVIFLRCFGKQELAVVPGGKILQGLGQLLGVF